MSSLEDSIFADPAMHAHFCAVAEVLSLFVAEPSGVISHAQLKRDSKRCAIEVRQVCVDLSAAGLLRKQGGRGERWLLLKDASEISLEDAYDCVLKSPVIGGIALEGASKKKPQLDSSAGRIEMIIMQAAMGINQANRRHLRLFYLHKLSA